MDELRSLGILGGTFNPPHLGHLAIACAAIEQLSLQRVLLVPAAAPPHKPIEHDPGPEARLAMCELLASETNVLGASPIELEREGPSYTVDTLRSVHASQPDAELTFIVGADIAGTLPSWREPADLLGLAELAVAPRPGADPKHVLAALAPLADPARVHFLNAQMLDVSSSLVRARAGAGEPLEELVGGPVASYIQERGLYGARARAVR